MRSRPVEYDTGFTLLPGKYTIKFLARDDETGRIGTYQGTFVIPNLNKEEKRVPTSSVVLSSQRVELKDALYNAAKTKDQDKQAAVNPLVQNGRKLIPSVTRVFSRSRDMYVYLQAYDHSSQSAPPAVPAAAAASGGTNSPPILAFVTFYRDKTKIFETKPIETPRNTTARLQTTPLNFTIPLDKLPPGEYDCQVTVLDPTGVKGMFWRTPIMLVP